MSIQYGLYKHSGILASNEVHAKTIKRNLVTTNDLANEIQQRCSLTTTDVKAVLSAMSELLGDHLLDGDHIKLDGIGTFSISIDSKVKFDKIGRPLLADPRVRKVSFRAASRLMRRMEAATFTREGVSPNVSRLDVGNDELLRIARTLCESNGFFTIREFVEASQICRSTAARRLAQLVNDGHIKRLGARPKYIYRIANQI